jgi:glucan phosphoethanolaminetransferase (alkaline phosphatase superfamily)
MKLFKGIAKLLNSAENLFYFFLLVLIVPNIALNFTETMSVWAKLCNLLLPFACYYMVMTLSRNSGKMFWILFPFVFLGAFQIVLLYLFGQSIIAVDMFLNLVTTNSTEAIELLDKLIPALVSVVILYVPALVMAAVYIIERHKVSERFIHRNRRAAVVFLGIGLASLGVSYAADPRYEAGHELFPVNVIHNACLAAERTERTKNYFDTSAFFRFYARSGHPTERREVYLLVIGETSRADNWSLFGYGRDTNPRLSLLDGVVTYPHVLSESNTTHKSVPMLLSAVNAQNFDDIYAEKGVITAFKEAGFRTAFFSNQRYNRSFIDFFGKEADVVHFIREEKPVTTPEPYDDELLPLVEQELAKGDQKLLIVLHTYGSHFNYRERYPASDALFLPDTPTDAKVKYRQHLVNAYDNSIRYTDALLASLIDRLAAEKIDAALLYTSDHGEDIFDDKRHLFLHASPVPSYYQIHVPLVLWMSDSYRAEYPQTVFAANANRNKNISSSTSFFHSIVALAGIQMPLLNDSLSITAPHFKEQPRLYLTDHNDALPLVETGMGEDDFVQLELHGISCR